MEKSIRFNRKNRTKEFIYLNSVVLKTSLKQFYFNYRIKIIQVLAIEIFFSRMFEKQNPLRFFFHSLKRSSSLIFSDLFFMYYSRCETLLLSNLFGMVFVV